MTRCERRCVALARAMLPLQSSIGSTAPSLCLRAFRRDAVASRRARRAAGRDRRRCCWSSARSARCCSRFASSSFPQVEAYRADIARWLATRLGQPVEIDAHRHRLGRLESEAVDPRLSRPRPRRPDRSAAARAAARRPDRRVDVAAAARPAAEGAPRSNGRGLSIRRDRRGGLHVAGIEIDPDAGGRRPPLADWLLRQREIVVRDALITWDDELRNAPQLVLDRVAVPARAALRPSSLRPDRRRRPPELAAPLDVRGDVDRRIADGLAASCKGSFYVRLDYADVAAWREWLPLPLPVESGKGALRVWFDFADGAAARRRRRPRARRRRRATLGDGLPPLDLAHLGGRDRAGSATDAQTRVASHAADVRAAGRHDARRRPTSRWRCATRAATCRRRQLAFDAARTRAAGRDRAAPAAARARAPRPRALRAARHAAQRRVVRVDGRRRRACPAYAAKAEFRGSASRRRTRCPARATSRGSFDATERGGRAEARQPRRRSFALPRVFAEPLAFDTLTRRRRAGSATAAAIARRSSSDRRVRERAMRRAPRRARWRSRAGGPGDVDLKAQLSRADRRAARHRYLPLGAGRAASRDWLRRALVKGTSSDARSTLAGDLAQFPFADGEGRPVRGRRRRRRARRSTTPTRWPAIAEIDARRALRRHAAVDRRVARRASSARSIGRDARRDRRSARRAARAADRRRSRAVRRASSWRSSRRRRSPAGPATSPTDATGDRRRPARAQVRPAAARPPTASRSAASTGSSTNAVRLPAACPPLRAAERHARVHRATMRAHRRHRRALGGPVKLQVVERGRTRARDRARARPISQRVRANTDAAAARARERHRPTGTLAARRATGRGRRGSLESSLEGRGDRPAGAARQDRRATTVALRVERREPTRRADDRIVVDYGRAGADAACTGSSRRSATRRSRAACCSARRPTKPPMPSSRGCGCAAICRRSTSTTGSRSTRACRRRRVRQRAPARRAGVRTASTSTAATLEALGRSFTRSATSSRGAAATTGGLTLDGARGRRHGRLARRDADAAERSHRRAPGAPGDAAGERRAPGNRRRRATADVRRARNPWPEIDIAADALSIEGPRPRQARVPRAADGHRLADREAGARNDAGRIDAEGLVARGARRSRRRSTSRSTRRRPARSSRASACPTPSRARRRRSTASSRGRARRATSTIRRCTGSFSFDVGRRTVHEDRSRRREAARRAVAAGAAAADLARLPRRVQRRLRVRHDHRRRQRCAAA